jgi:recombinational DNA repair ATPase RecF
MKIIQLHIENINRLSVVDITPGDGNVVIGGANGHGKSSVLNSIMYALGGKGVLPDKPVNIHATEGMVRADLGDIVVERKFNSAGNTYLSVVAKDGRKFPSPQAMLDDLVGRLSFDPICFARQKPAEQADTLRSLAGIDHTAMDAEYASVFADRTAVNRRVKELQAEVAPMTIIGGVPKDPIDVTEQTAKLRSLMAKQVEESKHRTTAAGVDEQVVKLQAEIEILQQQLEQKKAELTTTMDAQAQWQAFLASMGETVDADITAVQECIASASTTNEAIRKNAEIMAKHQKVREVTAEAAGLTKRLEEITARKAAEIAAAKMPIDGLSIDDTGVCLNGVPFSQASQAEQIRVSVAMGLAMNPKLKVLLIRDASLLDDASMQIVASLAANHDAQLWIERVGHDEYTTVMIEDGTVVAVPEEVAA